MAVDENLILGRKRVLVGLRLDTFSKELLDWAIVKVANPGDIVVAVNVCRDSDFIANEKALLDGYFEDYQGLCTEKQVALSHEVFKGNSIRKALVREAKNQTASVIVVGIAKHSAFRRWASIARYCANKLPSETEVMAIHNGKVVFSRCSTHQLEGPGEHPKPSFCLKALTFKNNHSDFGESEMRRFSFDFRDRVICLKNEAIRPFLRLNRGSLSSISLPVEDFTQQRPGWPLLQTTSSITQPSIEARNMSVVQWVMNLPHRSLSEISDSCSPTSSEDYVEMGKDKSAEISKRNEFASGKRLPKDLELILVNNSAECEVFNYEVLKTSTSDFSSDNLIGKGGCNTVYKGILPEGKSVAVKIFESSKDAWKEFIREVDIMTTLKHKRITPLLGICIEDNNPIHVYDFLSKGNLEDNLHGNGKKNLVLSWEKRFQIAVEIAEALNYLHHECSKPIIHRDVKSSNILLTGEFEPLLCDFGLAIWGPTLTSFVMDNDVVGTFGYLAPEYFMSGKVSNKIDVYAFGVVLLELLSGRNPIGSEIAKYQESLTMWAKPKLESGDLKSILDSNLDGNFDETQMQRMALAAALCLTQAARLRPYMCQILNVLNGEEYVDGVKPECGNYDISENKDENDDEVYPESRVESHFSLAFLDVNEDSSFSSLDQNSPLSIKEYLRQ